MNCRIESCGSIEQPGWLELRRALWPQCADEEHRSELAAFIAAPGRYTQYVAYSNAGAAVGLAEAALRSDYVNGTASSPVAFLEGLYVAPQARRHGVAAALVNAVCEWALGLGCGELASDALLDSRTSHAVHRALGFEETERVVFFRKALATQGEGR